MKLPEVLASKLGIVLVMLMLFITYLALCFTVFVWAGVSEEMQEYDKIVCGAAGSEKIYSLKDVSYVPEGWNGYSRGRNVTLKDPNHACTVMESLINDESR